MKKCTVCKNIKDVLCFYKDITAKDGLQSGCKTCRQKSSNKYYLRNKKKVLENSKRYRGVTRNIIKKIKESNPCMDCKIFYPYYVMDFDHLKNKSFRISWGVMYRSRALVLKEVKKCELVCSNCHRKRTFVRIIEKQEKDKL